MPLLFKRTSVGCRISRSPVRSVIVQAVWDSPFFGKGPGCLRSDISSRLLPVFPTVTVEIEELALPGSGYPRLCHEKEEPGGRIQRRNVLLVIANSIFSVFQEYFNCLCLVFEWHDQLQSLQFLPLTNWYIKLNPSGYGSSSFVMDV